MEQSFGASAVITNVHTDLFAVGLCGVFSYQDMALRRFVIVSFGRDISSFLSYGLYLELGYHSEASFRV